MKQLPARYVRVDGKRVKEPPEVTEERNRKWNDTERMPWPQEQVQMRSSSPLVDVAEMGERE